MSSFQYNDDEDQDENWDSPTTGRNGLVLLIDAGADMLKQTSAGKSYLQQSIECAKEIMLSIARKQKMDLVSLVFYGTERSEGKHCPNNVVLFQRLDVVTISRIKRTMELIKGECSEIPQKYGRSRQYVLAHAMHYCQTVLMEARAKMRVKNIILFTCNDDPYPDDADSQFLTRKQAKEFNENYIDFDVVGLGQFNSSKFYKELVLTARGELMKDWINQDPVLNISKLIDQIDKITEKYSQRRSYLWLGDKLALQTSLYKLYSEPKKFRTENVTESEFYIMEGSKVVVDRDYSDFSQETEDIAGEIDEQPEPETEKVLPQLLIGQYSVPMTKTELRQDLISIRLGFTLIGFVNTDAVPLYFTKSESYLMIPASNATNVRLIFSQLLNTCLQKKKSMLGWFKLNQSARLEYVVLHPTQGDEYASGKQHSGGFIINKLSFSDDLVEPDEAEGTEAEPNDSQQEAANGIVKKLTMNYRVNSFSDVEVRYRTNMIEALALEYDDVEDVEDDTDADLDGIAERLGDLNDAFNDCEHLGPEVDVSKGKGTAKRQIADVNPIEMIQNGLANKLNVTQLKNLLKAEGVKNLAAMNKAMLVSVANKRFGGPQES